jgi:epsilon-lactone hydrolase
MTISPQAQQFDQFLGSVTARSIEPGLDLATARDIVDSLQRASTEPEGVTYAEVDAGGVPAIWCIPQGADPDRALLHFHFGGSIVASMYSDRKAAGHIAKAAGIRSLVVDFRLAPENPYPAQLDDAETAYRWLLSQGYEPQNIGSTGHSIGGTLAVLLPLRLLAKGAATPGAIVSISPWCDLTIQNPTMDDNADKDLTLSRQTLERFRAAWLQDPALDVTDPKISILSADLTGLPPTALFYGDYEVLAGEDAELGLQSHLGGPPPASDPALVHPRGRTRPRSGRSHRAHGSVAPPPRRPLTDEDPLLSTSSRTAVDGSLQPPGRPRLGADAPVRNGEPHDAQLHSRFVSDQRKGDSP